MEIYSQAIDAFYKLLKKNGYTSSWDSKLTYKPEEGVVKYEDQGGWFKAEAVQYGDGRLAYIDFTGHSSDLEDEEDIQERFETYEQLLDFFKGMYYPDMQL